jgi:hypothetical protein
LWPRRRSAPTPPGSDEREHALRLLEASAREYLGLPIPRATAGGNEGAPCSKKNPLFPAGSGEADEGTRTLDLLHLSASAPSRLLPLLRFVVVVASIILVRHECRHARHTIHSPSEPSGGIGCSGVGQVPRVWHARSACHIGTSSASSFPHRTTTMVAPRTRRPEAVSRRDPRSVEGTDRSSSRFLSSPHRPERSRSRVGQCAGLSLEGTFEELVLGSPA